LIGVILYCLRSKVTTNQKTAQPSWCHHWIHKNKLKSVKSPLSILKRPHTQRHAHRTPMVHH